MRRYIISLLPLLLFVNLNAQVVINMDLYDSVQNVTLLCSIIDAKTEEPLAYSTVYLSPQGDTTITHLAMSNDKGLVEIRDIIPGKYEFHAEMIGYLPHIETLDLSGRQVNIGAIKMKENPENIDAASITALANPLTVKKDTLEYNAMAFHVGEHAVLEDLLNKMPGMKVLPDGIVTVNGEAVDKITVGGKTFFFNDPTIAVKNLPAKIVEKIIVINKGKDAAEFSGVVTSKEKEKVMDVQLKEEYRSGWFGKMQGGGGSVLATRDAIESDGKPSALFNGSLIAAGYDDNDQLTIIASAKNAERPGSSLGYMYEDFNNNVPDMLSSKTGIQTTVQSGANYNSERLKGFSTNSSINYNYSQKDVREHSRRTSLRSGKADMITDGTLAGFGYDHRVNASMEVKNKDTKKYMLTLIPSFSFTSRDRNISETSKSILNDESLNSSISSTLSRTNILTHRTGYTFGVKNLGRKGRNLTVSGSYNYRNISADSEERSVASYTSQKDSKALQFDTRDVRNAFESIITYVEPLTGRWYIQGRATGCYIGSRYDKIATDADYGTANSYYSSYVGNDDYLIRERLLLQYRGESATLLFGTQFDQEQNVNISTHYGETSRIGQGEWIFNWSPYADLTFEFGSSSLNITYGGNSATPSGANIMPVVNISNPTRMSIGNIYLRPSFSHRGSAVLFFNAPKSGVVFTPGLGFNYTKDPIVEANWFDANGNSYALPVNSRYPLLYSRLDSPLTVILGKKKRITLYINSGFEFDNGVSYQATRTFEGLDKQTFDYDRAMAWIWGDRNGSSFYGAGSAFSESSTAKCVLFSLATLNYRLDNFSVGLTSYVTNSRSRYSLYRNADVSTTMVNLGADLLYTTRKGWEYKTDMSYYRYIYSDYANGYGKPELVWNAGISKQIRKVSLNITLSDILDQRRSFGRTTKMNYIYDYYSNRLGRYLIIGVSFNFGKMNASNNMRVQRALLDMAM